MDGISIGLLSIKIIIGFITLFFIINITGRTSIYQLTPFHLVFVLLLGDLLGDTIYEDRIRVVHFLYAVGLWTLLMLIVEFLALKTKSGRAKLEGKPSIIIRDGIMDRNMMKKSKLDLNQVSSLLRQNNVFSVREVKYGILEPNGHITTLLQSKYQKPNKQDLEIPETEVDLPTALIIDGEILRDNLKDCGFDEQWLGHQLKAKGYDNAKSVFFADWKASDGIHISPK